MRGITLEEGQTLTTRDIDRIYKAIKAAREKVLDLARFAIFSTESKGAEHESGLMDAIRAMDAAYKEQFGHEQG